VCGETSEERKSARSSKSRGPVYTTRESEVGLGDVPQSDPDPMETEARGNVSFSALGAQDEDVPDIADRNERREEMRRLDREEEEALGPEAERRAVFAQAWFAIILALTPCSR